MILLPKNKKKDILDGVYMENQRIRLSKLILKKSLIKLLEQKDINKITVSEICKHAQINRSTFYKYYGSQYDLMYDIENEILVHIEECLDISDKMDNTPKMIRMLTFFNENIEYCRLLLNNNVDPNFPEKLMNLPIICHLVVDSLEEKYSQDEITYLYGLIVNGGYYN